MPKVIIIIAIIGVLIFSYKSNYFNFPITEVEIISNGTKHDTSNFNKLIANLQDKDLLSLDITGIQKLIITNEWIKDAEINKSFPSKLQIKIIQHKPYAIFNSLILTEDGSIIKSSTEIKNLPIIIDNTNNAFISLNILRLSEKYLNKIGLGISKIEVFNSLIKIETSANILISDRKNLEVNLVRLIDSYEGLKKLFKKDIKHIDMRYSNGFAIK